MEENDEIFKSRKKKRLGTSQIIAIFIIVAVIAYAIIASAMDGSLFPKNGREITDEERKISEQLKAREKSPDDALEEFEKEMDEILEQMEKDKKEKGIE